MSTDRPDFDIELDLGCGTFSVPAEELHFSNPLNKDRIFFVDKKSNCGGEFEIKNNELFMVGGDKISVGTKKHKIKNWEGRLASAQPPRKPLT